MSSSDQQDPLAVAAQAERELNSQRAKGNLSKSGADDSVLDSGVDTSVESRFPGASVQIGGQGAGDGRQIPESEGGDVLPSGKLTRAGDFEGVGGPEDKARLAEEARPGDDDVQSNVRQGGDTVRPPGNVSNAARDGAGGRQE